MRPYNRTLIVQLYNDGLHVQEVADQVGCSRSAVYRHLAAAGIKTRDDRLGSKPRPTHCKRGLHEFTHENTRVDQRGYYHCKECERTAAIIREAVKWSP